VGARPVSRSPDVLNDEQHQLVATNKNGGKEVLDVSDAQKAHNETPHGRSITRACLFMKAKTSEEDDRTENELPASYLQIRMQYPVRSPEIGWDYRNVGHIRMCAIPSWPR
jgi:hypothetical protein